jgi:hypothetical protein
MPLILFWAEVEEGDEKSVFSGLMKREEEEEETSILSGLMKMEEDEEEKKENFVFSRVIKREEA